MLVLEETGHLWGGKIDISYHLNTQLKSTKLLMQETLGSVPLGGNCEYVCYVNAPILNKKSFFAEITFSQGNDFL